MNRLRLIKTAYTALAALMLAACASDELTDGTVQDLPEGMYPLQIAGVSITAESNAEPWGADTPQTRVAEDTDGKGSHWEGEEIITVQLSGILADGTTYTATGEYQVAMDDKTSLAPVIGKELYWHSTSESTITSWYCYPAAAGDNTVDLSNQNNPSDPSSGLAYVLKSEASNVSYNTKPELKFKHQLAQIRVKLTGTKASAVTSVSVKGYTKCTVTEGVVSSSGTEGYISMKKPEGNSEYWEANVIPGTINKTAFLQVNGTAVNVETTLTKLDAARYYNFEVKVEKKQTEAKPNGDGSYTINAGDSVYIAGTVSGTITINGTADVELKDVTSNINTPIKITSGTPVIKITGTNTFTTKDGTPGIHLDGNGANVEITGDGSESSSLNIEVQGTNNGDPGSGIGSFGPYNSCGNIKISNITLAVKGGYDWSYDAGGAAIGTGAGFSGSCGSITIEKSVVSATAYPEAAAIGFGTTYEGGNIPSITITDSQLNLTVTGKGAGIGFGSNEDDSQQTLGPVTITSSNEDESTFFAKERFNVEGYKVGKSLYKDYTNQSWEGITFNGKTLVDGSSNGYK